VTSENEENVTKGKYGDIIIDPSALGAEYEVVDGEGDVKAKVYDESRPPKLYIRIRDHDDGRRFNEFSVPLGENDG
jgi:hypothetical protein